MPISGQRARPPVRNLFYLSFGGLLHHLLTERIALPAENLPQLFALIPVRMRRYNAVFGVGAEHIKITVLKAVLSFVEHIECFRLVLLHGGQLLSQAKLWLLWKCHIGLPASREE